MSNPSSGRSGRANRVNRVENITIEEWQRIEEQRFEENKEYRETKNAKKTQDIAWDSSIEEASIGKEEVKQIKKPSKRRPPRNAIEGLEV